MLTSYFNLYAKLFFLVSVTNTNDGCTSKHSEYRYVKNDKLSNGNIRLHLAIPEI